MLINVENLDLLVVKNMKIPVNNVDVIIGIETQIYLYISINDKNINLFTFRNLQCLKLFLKIININGIGAKMGAKLINQLGYINLTYAILQHDRDVIAKVNGFSNKSADKLIFNLKDKLDINNYEDEYINTAKQLLSSLNFKNITINKVLNEIDRNKYTDLNIYLKEILMLAGKYNE